MRRSRTVNTMLRGISGVACFTVPAYYSDTPHTVFWGDSGSEEQYSFYYSDNANLEAASPQLPCLKVFALTIGIHVRCNGIDIRWGGFECPISTAGHGTTAYVLLPSFSLSSQTIRNLTEELF